MPKETEKTSLMATGRVIEAGGIPKSRKTGDLHEHRLYWVDSVESRDSTQVSEINSPTISNY